MSAARDAWIWLKRRAGRSADICNVPLSLDSCINPTVDSSLPFSPFHIHKYDTWARCKKVLIKLTSGKVSDIFGGFPDEWFHHLRYQDDKVFGEFITKEALKAGVASEPKDYKEVASIDPGELDSPDKFKELSNHLSEYLYLTEGNFTWRGRQVPGGGIELTKKGQTAMGSDNIYCRKDYENPIRKHAIEALWNYFNV